MNQANNESMPLTPLAYECDYNPNIVLSPEDREAKAVEIGGYAGSLVCTSCEVGWTDRSASTCWNCDEVDAVLRGVTSDLNYRRQGASARP